MAGQDEKGFVPKTRAEVLEGIQARIRASFGAFARFIFSWFGNLIDVAADGIALCWDALAALRSGMDPRYATGTQQDAICALTGTTREAARGSTATLLLAGVPGTPIPAGSIIATAETDIDFETDEDATIGPSVSAWVSEDPYEEGDIFSHDGDIYYTTGDFSSAGIPDPTNTEIVGEGSGYVWAAVTASEVGPQEAEAGAITNIKTSVLGWGGAYNPEVPTLGRLDETHAELRIRRDDEVVTGGTPSIDAIRVALLKVDGVTQARVFENTSQTTDGDGVPPHGIEAVVIGGVAADIVDTLWYAGAAAGIPTSGDEAEYTQDSEGNDVLLRYSRPDLSEIYVIANLEVDEDEYPTNGDDQVKRILAPEADEKTEIDELGLTVNGTGIALEYLFGQNVVAWNLASLLRQVAGVKNVTSLYIGTAPAPGASTTIAIGTRGQATFAKARVTVNTTPYTP